MPKVSVIVPNYRHAPYLEKRLQSISTQSFQDFELIVLDDCSPDNSLEILHEIRKRIPFKLIENKQNSGSPFKQWNKGVSHANGEYIWIAESDDFSHPDFLKTMVDVLDRNPNVGISHCLSWLISQENLIIGVNNTYFSAYFHENKWKSNFIANGPREIFDSMVPGNCVPNASATVFRKSIYQKAGMAPESYRLAGDWLIWTRMLKYSDISFTSKPMNFYRTHMQNVRSSVIGSKADWEHLQVRLEVLRIVGLSKRSRKAISLCIGEIDSLNRNNFRWMPNILKISKGNIAILFIVLLFKILRDIRKKLRLF